MILLMESSDDEFDYKEYKISSRDGVYDILDSDGDVIASGFSSDRDAIEFIDNSLSNSTGKDSKDKGNFNKKSTKRIPVTSMPKQTTIKMMSTRYKRYSGEAYVLSSDEYRDKYASRNGLCSFGSDDMLVFKSIKDATNNARFRKSKFTPEKINISNGEIKLK